MKIPMKKKQRILILNACAICLRMGKIFGKFGFRGAALRGAAVPLITTTLVFFLNL